MSPEAGVSYKDIVFENFQPVYGPKIYRVWETLCANALSNIEPVAGILTPENIADWNNFRDDPRMLAHKDSFRTLNGVVFEHLAFSYLVSQSSGTDTRYAETNGLFDQIVEELKKTEGFSVEPKVNTNFTGVWIKKNDQTVVIPDGFIFEFDHQTQRAKLTGIFESNVGNRRKFIRHHKLFTEAVRNNPILLNLVGRNCLEAVQTTSVNEDDFRYLAVVKENLNAGPKKDMKDEGWEVEKAPFTIEDSQQMTAQLIRSYPFRKRSYLT